MASIHLLNAGNVEQKEKYLADIILGNKISCVAVTEPHAGSDVKNIRTKAQKVGNKYLINSKSAEVNAENEELIKLIDVTAVIYLKERSPIYIESDYAIHNKNVFDTKFYDNVNIRHDKIKISLKGEKNVA